jgi:hypothetical protein
MEGTVLGEADNARDHLSRHPSRKKLRVTVPVRIAG